MGVGDAVLAFDVGGTDMKAALVDEVGSIRDVVRVPTPIGGERTGWVPQHRSATSSSTLATGQVVSGAKDVLDRAQAGDLRARETWESALDALALDLSHTVALLAPEAIVIGGGLSQAGAALFEPLERRLDAILTFHRRPQLLCASIGENAGVVGAALRARDLVNRSSEHLRR
jgi:predicted NBD/HSP70 family sugar kinase